MALVGAAGRALSAQDAPEADRHVTLGDYATAVVGARAASVTREGSRSSLLVPASDLGRSLLATTLYPGGFSVRDGIRGGVTSLLFTELVSTAREFWPRRHR